MNPISGKEFEALILFRAQRLEEQGILTLGRYGTQVVMMNDEQNIPRWQPIPSLPDFDGCLMGGRQWIIEAKVCSQASYPIYHTGKDRPKQMTHMIRRAKFGALCHLFIHFNARELKTKSDEAATYAIEIHPDNHFTRMYENAELRTLSRPEAEMHGALVPWDLYSARASKLTPNISTLIK